MLLTQTGKASYDVFCPFEVEVLCSMLRLPDLPEHSLMKLCNSILSLSPDLSYSTAASLIRSLLLEKVHQCICKGHR